MHVIELANIDDSLNQLYTNFYYYFIIVLSLGTVFILSFGNKENKLKSSYSRDIYSIALSVGIILYFGLATLFGIYISDTILYEWSFRHIDATTPYVPWGEREALFDNLQIFIYNIGGDQYAYFATFLAIIYIGTILLVCYKLMRFNVWVALMFFFTSFSFYGYGVNGIRNGAACHIVMLGIIYLLEQNRLKTILAFVLFVIAYYIHSSTMLPIACALISRFFNLKTSYAIAFWGISIIISLIAGNAIGEIFLNLGFDDRFDRYFKGQENLEQMQKDFSYVGFRFDFLLYSAMPILFVWYLTIKRNFNDFVFNVIANTYILANSFWIMVISSSYSNRFAYLSWFLYPLVFAYPLSRMNIWEKQERKTAFILLAYTGFTLIMFLLR